MFISVSRYVEANPEESSSFSLAEPRLSSEISERPSTSQTASLRAIPPIAEPVVMTWHPTPDKIDTAMPSQPVTYHFSQVTDNTMLLIPSQESSSSRPVYHISWREDYFISGSMITTLRRGGTGDGQYVGMFE